MFKLITSWDDGYILDWKLAELLKKYNIPAIFFIPKDISNLRFDERISDQDIISLSKDFTIGAHTLTHPNDLKELDDDDLVNELKGGKEWLEKLIGKPVTDFCYPSGKYQTREVTFLKELGYKTARTTCVGNIEKPKDKFRIRTTIHCYPSRPEYYGDDWMFLARKMFLEAKARNSYYHLWGHSWEIEKFGLWKDVESIFQYISENK